MTLSKLRQRLIKEDVPNWAYWLDGGHPAANHPGGEACCIDQVGDEWQTYFSERGTKTNVKAFDSEEEACSYFYQWLIEDDTVSRAMRT